MARPRHGAAKQVGGTKGIKNQGVADFLSDFHGNQVGNHGTFHGVCNGNLRWQAGRCPSLMEVCSW